MKEVPIVNIKPELVDILERVLVMAKEGRIIDVVVLGNGWDSDGVPAYINFGDASLGEACAAFEYWKAKKLGLKP